jgi:hypothetical protein
MSSLLDRGRAHARGSRRRGCRGDVRDGGPRPCAAPCWLSARLRSAFDRVIAALASPPSAFFLISATHPFNYYFPLSSSINFADLTRICSRWFPRVEIREKFSCLFFRDGETESAM